MTEPRLERLTDLQPSQLYISSEKLKRVLDAATASEALPVRRMGPHLVLTDGHTRAVAAHLRGLTEIAVRPETDELDWEAYRVCVRWCREEGIRSVVDLAARVVDAEAYQRLWIERCRRLHQRPGS